MKTIEQIIADQGFLDYYAQNWPGSNPAIMGQFNPELIFTVYDQYQEEQKEQVQADWPAQAREQYDEYVHWATMWGAPHESLMSIHDFWVNPDWYDVQRQIGQWKHDYALQTGQPFSWDDVPVHQQPLEERYPTDTPVDYPPAETPYGDDTTSIPAEQSGTQYDPTEGRRRDLLDRIEQMRAGLEGQGKRPFALRADWLPSYPGQGTPISELWYKDRNSFRDKVQPPRLGQPAYPSDHEPPAPEGRPRRPYEPWRKPRETWW